MLSPHALRVEGWWLDSAVRSSYLYACELRIRDARVRAAVRGAARWGKSKREREHSFCSSTLVSVWISGTVNLFSVRLRPDRCDRLGARRALTTHTVRMRTDTRTVDSRL